MSSAYNKVNTHKQLCCDSLKIVLSFAHLNTPGTTHIKTVIFNLAE